ncbi:RNA polymerase sigma factor [Streptomyces chartreusis]|uniref:RNA polymerase sigma factor n=1 Tax=Streptomyces chartreusis TaxID=1969 RepID=UPI0036DB06AE
MSERQRAAEELGQLFARYRGEMYGKARQLLDQALIPQSLADSDDIVSAAFTVALRRAHELENPRAYVYQVMRNEVKQLERTRSAREAIAAARAIDPWHWDNPLIVPDFSDRAADRVTVVAALRDLPVQQRTAVFVVDGLDFTRQETADLMEVHPGTVARHVSRGRIALLATLIAVVGMVLRLGGGGGHDTALACVGPDLWRPRRDEDEDLCPGTVAYEVWRLSAALERAVHVATVVVTVVVVLVVGWRHWNALTGRDYAQAPCMVIGTSRLRRC